MLKKKDKPIGKVAKRVVKSKQNLSWHFVSMYLEALYNMNFLMKNPDFYRIFLELEKCVDDNIKTEFDGNIVDIYVIVEQEKNTAQK